MGAKLRGNIQLSAEFLKLARELPTAAASALHAEGEAISEVSKGLAPVDLGNLEAAHQVITEKRPSGATTTISVGGTVDGVDVDAYSLFTHYGDYKLGPKSQAKAAATGARVGPGFLERAFQRRKKGMAQRLAEAMRSAIRK